jgi:hypothetical protein
MRCSADMRAGDVVSPTFQMRRLGREHLAHILLPGLGIKVRHCGAGGRHSSHSLLQRSPGFGGWPKALGCTLVIIVALATGSYEGLIRRVHDALSVAKVL